MIIIGDCFEKLNSLDEEVNMVFLDPPYDMKLNKKQLVQRPEGGVYQTVQDDWDNIEDYTQFTRDYLTLVRALMHQDATLWLCGTYHGIFKAVAILQELKFWILNDITWIKTNPTPNFSGRRFCQSTETIIWAAKSEKSKYTFNYKLLKEENGGKQMRSDWVIKPPVKIKRNGKSVNAAQKPEELLTRIIKASTNPGDVVLDPFAGTLTTAVVCERLGRGYICIEQDPDQVEVGKFRLSQIPEKISEVSL